MGPWSFLLRKVRFLPLEVIARPESASPATGYKKVHQKEHAHNMERAFAPTGKSPKSKDKPKKELSKA